MAELREGEALEAFATLRDAAESWPTPNRYTDALDSLAAQVENLLSQLERLQGIAENDREAYLSVHRKLDAAEQRARRAEEALLEVERCANGNASPEVLRRHVRRALDSTQTHGGSDEPLT